MGWKDYLVDSAKLAIHLANPVAGLATDLVHGLYKTYKNHQDKDNDEEEDDVEPRLVHDHKTLRFRKYA